MHENVDERMGYTPMGRGVDSPQNPSTPVTTDYARPIHKFMWMNRVFTHGRPNTITESLQNVNMDR